MKPLRLTIAWLLVAIPLAWGVSRSIEKSLPLFQFQSTPAAAR